MVTEICVKYPGGPTRIRVTEVEPAVSPLVRTPKQQYEIGLRRGINALRIVARGPKLPASPRARSGVGDRARGCYCTGALRCATRSHGAARFDLEWV